MSENSSITKSKAVPAKAATPKQKAPIAKATPAKTAPAKRTVSKVVAAAKPVKKIKRIKKSTVKVEPKIKVVRDSFTMPQIDYVKISELKLVCQKAGLQVKKSELLRAGLTVLCKLDVAQLKQTITQMEQIKTGRPKKT
jgi:hypothetical protein